MPVFKMNTFYDDDIPSTFAGENYMLMRGTGEQTTGM